MRLIMPLIAAAMLFSAGGAFADKPGTTPGHSGDAPGLSGTPPGQAQGGWDTHQKGYEDKSGSLPHGMQKKLERTGELPPGWEKKVQVGNVLDPYLYERSSRLSGDLAARLPSRPEGTIDVRLQDRVVRLREQDRRITDVFQLNLR